MERMDLFRFKVSDKALVLGTKNGLSFHPNRLNHLIKTDKN